MDKWLDKLERRWRHLAIANLTIPLIAGQVAFYIIVAMDQQFYARLVLIPQRVFAGELWRVFTFAFEPPTMSPIFVIFGWYILWLMGSGLESHWGTFRYNLYVMIAYAAMLFAAFISPPGMPTSLYLGSSIFLAFAYLYPNFELCIFFLLPIKIKYLALLTWFFLFLSVAQGSWLMPLASVANFLIFFGRDLFWRAKAGNRRIVEQRRRIRNEQLPFHECAICGITEKTHPNTDFRYCSKCDGDYEYCEEHLRTHEHVVAQPPEEVESSATAPPTV